MGLALASYNLDLLPKAKASERQRCGILRQAHFITTSEKGVSEPSWIGKATDDTE